MSEFEEQLPSDLGDDDLIVLAKNGDLNSFEILVRRYQLTALRVAAKYTGQPSLAADIAQNAFIELHRYLPKYQPRGTFRAFFFSPAHESMPDGTQKMSHPRSNQSQLLEFPVPEVIQLEDIVMQRETIQKVDGALRRISEKLRVVLVLRFLAGLSYREISEVLKLPVGTVQSRLSAGLAKLRDALGVSREQNQHCACQFGRDNPVLGEANRSRPRR